MRKRNPPFWPILNLPEGTCGDFAIRHRHYEAGHKFRTTSMRTAMFGGHPGKDITFDTPVRYHQLTEEGRVWMEDVPIEQFQADRAVKKYNGRVLVGGLGLGYAATRIAYKRDVDAVMVVEISQEVIDLVAPHLPTRARNKMTFVCADLQEWLEQRNPMLSPYTYAFYDTWASDGEGTFFDTVVPLLQISRGHVLRKPDCWNEDIMRGQLRLALESMVMRMAHPEIGAPLTIEELCTEKGSIYWDWHVAFFRWVRDEGEIAADKLMAAIAAYTSNYGHPFFDTWWKEVFSR